MSAAWSKRVKSVVPRAVRLWLWRRLHGAIFSGDYSSWAAARAASHGYDDQVIFDKTVEAARAVRSGPAIWDRDTKLFYEPGFHQPLLDALRVAAAANEGRLILADFGGALGSTWWQHRAALVDLVEVRWSVIEQARFVAAGQKEFTQGPLRFYATLDLCCERERPQVALLSAVLPYLENPHALVRQIAARGFDRVIIDRTGFVRRNRDRLTVQHVPASIYSASYPCWFFNRPQLLKCFQSDWRVVAEWPAFDRADIDADYRGLMLERIRR